MKKLISVILSLCMAAMLAACGSSAPATQPAETTTKADVLESQSGNEELKETGGDSVIRDKISVIEAPSQTLAPWGTRNGVPGIYEAYEMLYEMDNTGAVYPVLADATYDGNFLPGMDHEEGSGVYTVHIYDYIHDHAGNKITASDVAFSFTHQFKEEATSGWEDMVSVEATDDTTVVMTFTEDQTGLGEFENIICRQFIVSEKAYNDSPSKFAADMCGTGPYKFVKYDSGAQLELEAYDDYWQTDETLRRQEQKANVKTITYEYITESAQKVVALKTGATDIVADLSYEDALDFADGGEYDDQFNVYTYLQKFVHFATPNCSPESICGDVNMRLAIFNAIDLNGLCEGLGGTMQPLPAYISAFYSDCDYVDWASLENYNTKAAVDEALVNEYLEKAGYNGEKVRIITSGDDDAAQLISAQLAMFGIDSSVQSLDRSTANSVEADATAWDLNIGMMAGDFIPQVWLHGFSFGNTATGDHSTNFVTDKAWDDLLNLCNTQDGHTAENMQKWWEMTVENGYTMGLYTGNAYNVVPADMTYVLLGDKNLFLPGGCEYK